MSVRHAAGFALVAALGVGWLWSGCGDDATCTAGQQVACACGGGLEGFQSCNSDGTAFGPCNCDGAGGSGAEGGGATVGGAGPASSSSQSSSSASTGGMGTGGMGGAPSCDGTGQCEDSDPDPTNDCFACAIERQCKTEGEACGASVECLLYNDCIKLCGSPPDPTCKADCDTQQPQGSAIYSAAADCFCFACPMDCANSFCQF